MSLNDIGTVTLRTSSVIIRTLVDNRDSGAFILIDETTNDTIGAGTIIEAREIKPGTHARTESAGILQHWTGHRWQATGQPGATIWFTGLPASVNRQSRSLWNVHSSNRDGWPICSTG